MHNVQVKIITLCILGKFSCFNGHLLTFFKINFFKKKCQTGLDQDQDRCSVAHDLGLNCLQRSRV